MSDATPTVVVLSGTGENDAINGLMRAVAATFERCGHRVAYFDLKSYDQGAFFTLLSSGNVPFAITYLGIGQNLEVELKSGGKRNIWEFFNIPLLKIHGDIPAYFLERHADFPANAVNLYWPEEFLDYLRVALDGGSVLSARMDPWLIDDLPPTEDELAARRQGRLFLVKNGGDPAALQADWKAKLPPPVAQQLLELAEEARATCLKAHRINLHQLVTGHFRSRGIHLRGDALLVSFYVAQMDDYLRKLKATLVAQTLAAYPVVIQGSRWDHIDRAGARAEFRPAQDFEATAAIYRRQLGVIDLSPNLDSTCHDRLMRAAGNSAFALTNKSTWLAEILPALNGLAFDFDADSIRNSVEAALSDPARCLDLGLDYGRAFRQKYPSQAFVDHLASLAAMSRLRHDRQKPVIQPYMVW